MKWLEKHLREFVLPAIREVYAGRTRVESLEPYTKALDPAPDCFCREAGILKSALKRWGIWTTPKYSDDYHRSLGNGAVSMQTLNLFKTFQLNRYELGGHNLIVKPSQSKFSVEQIFHSVLKNSVKNLGHTLSKGSKLLLLGRDVWAWAVLCEKMGVPYVYDPRVSRQVACAHKVFKNILFELGAKEGDILFDTGFAGSIYYNAVQATDLKLVNLMFSATNNANQQFRNNGVIRNRALFAEYLPKYFLSGRVASSVNSSKETSSISWWTTPISSIDGVAFQDYSTMDEIVSCALTTMWIWLYQSPSWIPGPSKPKGMQTVNRKIRSPSNMFKNYDEDGLQIL